MLNDSHYEMEDTNTFQPRFIYLNAVKLLNKTF